MKNHEQIQIIPFPELTDDQIKSIWEWRNDISIRKWMKNTELIPWENHVSFVKSLKSINDRYYFLVLDWKDGVGVINIHKRSETLCEAGLYKSPAYKSGAGDVLLQSIEKVCRKAGYSKIVLEVLTRNERAIRLYKRSGYRVYGYKGEYLIMSKNVADTANKKCFIIAELSANHGGNIKTALESITAAASTGVDAIKIQTYTADTLTIDSDNEYFKINQGTLWDGRTLYNLYEEAYMPWEWHSELKSHAEELGLTFFSTPFDYSAVDFLEKHQAPIYKIASFEITDIPLIEYAASKGKPMIISTGIASIQEIQDAVEACRRVGNEDITLLKCTSSYPAPVDQANLRTMVNMKETFGVKVGLSDHTMGSDVAMAAAALGAEVIEKHFILDRSIGGPDADFSMEPDDFRKMVQSVRNIEKTLGAVDYRLTESKIQSRKFARSLFVVEDVEKGDLVSEQNVRSIRPGDGMAPKELPFLLGKRFVKGCKKGTPLKSSLIND